MTKIFHEQLFFMDNGEDFLIDVVVEDGCVTDIIAAQDIHYKDYSFLKGEVINVDGEESMIRSGDIDVELLEYNY